MPPRPFPFTLGIGIDIVHLPRITRLMQKGGTHESQATNLGRFLNRFLTWREKNIFWRFYGGNERHVLGDKSLQATRFLAGRWAAKEAVIKAVSYRKLGFHDIEILRSGFVAKGAKTGPIYALILDEPASSFGQRRMTADEATPNDSQIALEEELTMDPSVVESPSSNDEGAETPTPSLWRTVTDESHARDPDGQIAKISISHDGDYVTAVCLAAEEPRVGDVGGEAAAREP